MQQNVQLLQILLLLLLRTEQNNNSELVNFCILLSAEENKMSFLNNWETRMILVLMAIEAYKHLKKKKKIIPEDNGSNPFQN